MPNSLSPKEEKQGVNADKDKAKKENAKDDPLVGD